MSLDGYSIKDYGGMVFDQRRTKPFVEALRRAITPETVVLEIGTGPGFFAFLAAQFGAARIYAVEPDESIELARRLAPGIPGSEKIEWIRDITTRIDLPEKADLILGDLHGVLPFYTGNIRSFIDARERLAKPGALTLPHRDHLFAAPASSPANFRYVEQPWLRNDYGLDLAAGVPAVANTWWRMRAGREDPPVFLAEAQRWGVIDYATVTSPNLTGELTWQVAQPGPFQGYCVWFDGDMGDGLGYTNSPLEPELVYGTAFFPLPRQVDLKGGESVHVKLSANLVQDEYVYRWDTDVTGPGGERIASFRQSTFLSRIVDPAQLQAARPEHVPTLSEQGESACVALQAFAEGCSLGEAAARLQARFPDRYPDASRALQEALKVSRRYA